MINLTFDFYGSNELQLGTNIANVTMIVTDIHGNKPKKGHDYVIGFYIDNAYICIDQYCLGDYSLENAQNMCQVKLDKIIKDRR